MNDYDIDVLYKKTQKRLPLNLGKEYRIVTCFGEIIEGVYLNDDALNDVWRNKHIGGYWLFIDEKKVWSANIIDFSILRVPYRLHWLEKEEKVEKVVKISNNPDLDIAIKKVIEDNPKVVLDYKSGKKNAVGFLVGQVKKIDLNFRPDEVKLRLENNLK